MTASATRREARLVQIDTPDRGLPDARRRRQTLEHLVADKALIDAAQSFGESLEHALPSADHLGDVVQQAPTVELSDVMSDSLDAKSALAFGIDLQSQLAAMQLCSLKTVRSYGGLSTATRHSAARMAPGRYFGRPLSPRIVVIVFRSSGARLRSSRAWKTSSIRPPTIPSA